MVKRKQKKKSSRILDTTKTVSRIVDIGKGARKISSKEIAKALGASRVEKLPANLRRFYCAAPYLEILREYLDRKRSKKNKAREREFQTAVKKVMKRHSKTFKKLKD